MRNFLKYCCVGVLFCLISSVWANSKLEDLGEYSAMEGVEGIYLCTKNIDRPDSLMFDAEVGLEVGSNVEDNSFLPFYGVAESGEQHRFGRYCFMLYAKAFGVVKEVDGAKRLVLEKIDSYGFGKLNGRTAAYKERLEDLPKNMAISCTLLVSENHFTLEEVINKGEAIKKRIKIDEFEMLCNSKLVADCFEIRKFAKGELLQERWRQVMFLMNLESYKRYNLSAHNCCTVAYDVSSRALFNGDDSPK